MTCTWTETWTGTLEVGQPVAITLGATVNGSIAVPSVVVNEAIIVGGVEGALTRRATTLVNPLVAHLPLGLRRYGN